MDRRTLYSGCCIIIGLTIAACTAETDSENIKTSGIHAVIRAFAAGDGNTAVSTQLTVGKNGVFATNIDLTGGDTLTASSGSTTTTLVKEKDWFTGAIYYKAILPGDTAGTEIKVSFIRPNDTAAPNSTVSLPYAPALTAPTEGESFSQAQDITVTWDNTNSDLPITLEFDFNCAIIGGGRGFDVPKANIANTGSITYPISSLLGSLVLKTGESCNTTITISREAAGSLDSHYGEGGLMTAIQYRKITVTITP